LYRDREAEKNWEQWHRHPRRVKNPTHVKRLTENVGAVLSERTDLSPSPEEGAAPAQDGIRHVDGGHLPIQEKAKRRFAALAARGDQPEQIQAVERHHRQIMAKPCVISARDEQ